jgi:biotin transport system substrate-specific component
MKVKDMTKVAVFAALTCSIAVIFRYVPATIVPFSLLPIVVLLAGFVLGPRLGALAMLIYALLGIVGFPVFASPPFGGITYILKPTFGYILGYIPAAYVVGKLLLLSDKRNFLISSLAVLGGLASLYLVGLSYLYLSLNLYLHSPIGIIGVIEKGLLPFLLLDLLKGIVAAVIGNKLHGLLKQID